VLLAFVTMRAVAASFATSSFLVASLFLAGCQEPLPIPRIEPGLENWSQPYKGVPDLKVHAFRTGAVRSIEGAVFAGGSWTSTVQMGAWAFVVEHPTSGLIVFDTGMSDRGRTEPEHYVGWLGAKLGMLKVPEGATLASQMRANGLDPANVTRVVVSHVHFDHTGGIRDFPNATIVVSLAEKSWVVRGVRKTDFVDLEALQGMERWQTIDFSVEKPLATLLAAHDLLGDGSVFAVDLSGHTPGSTGLVVRTADAPILLTGDAAWTKKSWMWPARPISAYDMTLWWEQAWRIKRFALLEPRLVVIPGHDDLAVADAGVATFIPHDPPGASGARVAAVN
jgi:glyoxylase-like metal-dependent hydrolase (beta-lactamase superfamily II)